MNTPIAHDIKIMKIYEMKMYLEKGSTRTVLVICRFSYATPILRIIEIVSVNFSVYIAKQRVILSIKFHPNPIQKSGVILCTVNLF